VDFGLRHKIVDSVFVKGLLLLFFQEKKQGLGRRPKVLILVFNKFGTLPDFVYALIRE
jgi:hypothetical protein